MKLFGAADIGRQCRRAQVLSADVPVELVNVDARVADWFIIDRRGFSHDASLTKADSQNLSNYAQY